MSEAVGMIAVIVASFVFVFAVWLACWLHNFLSWMEAWRPSIEARLDALEAPEQTHTCPTCGQEVEDRPDA